MDRRLESAEETTVADNAPTGRSAPATSAGADLRRRSVRAGTATVVSQGLRFAFQMVSTVVLARLLSPADFGLIAMVTAITNFALVFSHLGLSTATVQHEAISHSQVSGLFWVNAGFGLLVALIVVAASPLLTWFYQEPQLTSVASLLSLTFVFSGLAVQHRALLTRKMRFVAIGIADVVGVASGVVVAIVAAMFGAGYWALVIMHVTTQLASMVGFWIAERWRPRFTVPWREIVPLLKFGSRISAFNIVNYFSRNGDNVLIGRFLGSVELGFYTKAYNLMMLPVRQIRGPIYSVGLPALSRLQKDPDRYRSYYLRIVHLTAFLSVPMALFLGAFAYEVIGIMLGPDWLEAAAVFRILALSAAMQPVTGTSGMVMQSLGLGKRQFRLGLVRAIAFIASFAAGIPWGIGGVAIGFTVVYYLSVLPVLHFAFKGTPVSVRGFLSAIWIPGVAAIVMVVGSRAAVNVLVDPDEWLRLLLGFPIAAALYFGVHLLLPGGPAVLREFLSDLKLLEGR